MTRMLYCIPVPVLSIMCFFYTSHFFAQLVSILTTRQGGKKRRKEGRRKKKRTEGTNRGMVVGWLRRREGKAGEKGRGGEGKRWDRESRMSLESMAEKSGVNSRFKTFYLYPQ